VCVNIEVSPAYAYQKKEKRKKKFLLTLSSIPNITMNLSLK